MRIMVVHAWYRDDEASGENRVARQESEHLRAFGHEVEFLRVDNRDLESLGTVGKALMPARLVRSRPARNAVRAAIDAFGPDVVHVHNVFPSLSPSVFLACRDAGVPAVATLHNYRAVCARGELFRDGARCTECFGNASLPAITHACGRGSHLFSVAMAAHVEANLHVWQEEPVLLLALSRAMRDLFLQAGFRPEQVVVKGNAVEDRPARRVADPRSIAFLGRLTEVKGIAFLRRAWAEVAPLARAEGITLEVAGAGPLDDMVHEWAAADPTVRHLGPQTADECRDLVARSRAVVVPSVWPEPFGLVAVEAMCGGVAPVCPDDGSFPDMLTQGRDGLLYAQGDHRSLADALRHLIGDPDHAARMGAAARRTYEDRYTPAANVRALEAVYRMAIDRAAFRDDRAYAR